MGAAGLAAVLLLYVVIVLALAAVVAPWAKNPAGSRWRGARWRSARGRRPPGVPADPRPPPPPLDPRAFQTQVAIYVLVVVERLHAVWAGREAALRPPGAAPLGVESLGIPGSPGLCTTDR